MLSHSHYLALLGNASFLPMPSRAVSLIGQRFYTEIVFEINLCYLHNLSLAYFLYIIQIFKYNALTKQIQDKINSKYKPTSLITYLSPFIYFTTFFHLSPDLCMDFMRFLRLLNISPPFSG